MADADAPFKQMLGMASGGSTLQIDNEKMARQLTEAVGKMLSMVELVEANTWQVAGEGAEHAGMFGGLLSSLQLQGKVTGTGDTLRTRLSEHKKILTAIGHTFVTAGKLYEDSDESTEGAFNRIKKSVSGKAPDGFEVTSAKPTVGATSAPLFLKPGLTNTQSDKLATYDPDKMNIPAPIHPGDGTEGMTKMQKSDQRNTAPVDLEASNSLEYDDFYRMNNNLTASKQRVVDIGRAWTWMHGQMNTDATALRDAVDKAIAGGMWSSPAAQKARNSIDGYTNDVVGLADNTKVMGGAVDYTVRWLDNVQSYLPTKSSAELTGDKEDKDAQINKATGLAREAFSRLYSPAVDTASNSIPLLSEAVSPVTGGLSGEGSGTNGSGDGTGTNGGSGTGGSGSSGGYGGGFGGGSGSGLRSGSGGSGTGSNGSGRQGTSDGTSGLGRKDNGGSTGSNGSGGGSGSGGNGSGSGSGSSSGSGSGLAEAAKQMGLASSTGDKSTGADKSTAGKDGLSALEKAKEEMAKNAAKGGGGGGGVGGGGGGLGGAGLPKDTAGAAASKLFPRAAAAVPTGALGRAGLAGMASPGMPGGMGPAGAGAGGQQGGGKEHKRADYLDSADHLDEALGEAPVVAKPVVER
ncbi:hypothetical protein ACWF9G_00790 [Nocardia sp. NPDC055029]